jgi:hypothetical protein
MGLASLMLYTASVTESTTYLSRPCQFVIYVGYIDPMNLLSLVSDQQQRTIKLVMFQDTDIWDVLLYG